MKHCCILALIALTGMSTLSRAQSAGNPLLHHIPVDADKVYHINFTVLSGKLDLQALGVILPKNEENQKLITYLSDPGQIGIDVRPGIFIAQTNISKLDSPRYTSLLLPLSDSAKFIKFLKDNNKPADGQLTIHPGKLRTGVQGKTVFAWNDKLVVITIIKAPLMTTLQEKNPGANPSGDMDIHKYMPTATRRSIAALMGAETSPFITDPNFATAIGDDADAHTYSRFGGGFGMMADVMRMTHAPVSPEVMAAMEKMKHSHMHTIGTIRFDNGRMSMRSRLFYDSLGDYDIGLRPINTSLIERLPQGNLLGFFALHIDPTAYLNLLQRLSGGNGTHALDSMLAKKGLTVKDILSAFKGDVLVAAIDNGKTIPATDSTKAKPGKPTIYAVLTIADRAAFDKFDNLVHLTRDSAEAAPAGATAKPKMHLAHTLRDDILVLGADKQATEDFFNNPGRGPNRLESEEVRSAPVAIAIDVKAIGAWVGPSLAGSSKDQQAKIIFGLFDQVVLTVGRPRGKEIETLFEIKMADQQQNSLTTISKLISQMGKK